MKKIGGQEKGLAVTLTLTGTKKQRFLELKDKLGVEQNTAVFFMAFAELADKHLVKG